MRFTLTSRTADLPKSPISYPLIHANLARAQNARIGKPGSLIGIKAEGSAYRRLRVRVATAARSRIVISTGPEAPTRRSASLQPEGQVCVLTLEPLSGPR